MLGSNAGLVVTTDVTDYLSFGYFPSFNVPLNKDVYAMSGYPSMVRSHASLTAVPCPVPLSMRPPPPSPSVGIPLSLCVRSVMIMSLRACGLSQVSTYGNDYTYEGNPRWGDKACMRRDFPHHHSAHVPSSQHTASPQALTPCPHTYRCART